MNNATVRLFLGDTISEPSERELISRLQGDLKRRGVRATMYANFFPATRGSRQVDLLVRTDSRTAHVEIKGLRPDHPLRAGPNGPWVQVRPDGSERSLDTNCGRQALNGTYAIGDAMRDMTRKGVVTGVDDGFKRHIDSIVGMWEAIPSGSEIKPPPHVTVLGYSDLLRRVTEPGPVVPWTDEEWDEFARRHDLYQLEPESESERRRRSGLALITDYRELLALSSLAEGLGRFVDLGATDSHETTASAADMSRRVSDGGVIALVGASGCGKSFLAQHLALRHSEDGRLVVWIRSSDYKRGRFKESLARAMAPFSAGRWNTVVAAAEESGTAITVVIDGLNECPNDERGELLQQLRAFTLRHRASVLVTSTAQDGLRDTLGAEIFRVGVPDEQPRLEILHAYGAKHPERISDQFRTPYELSVAAKCENELDEHASITELHAAYIRRFAPTEQLRAGLRSLASRMHEQFRTSLPQHQATAILHSRAGGLSPRQVDEVLECALLAIDGHRVRFRHELIGQFLAAEDIVRSASSGQSLGLSLTSPANTVLIDAALGIESNHGQAWEALTVLARPELIFGALTKTYGPELAEKATQEIRDVLRRAIASTQTTTAAIDSDHGLLGRWRTERAWTDLERALLAAAGRGLTKGLFIDEICELIDRTDEVCLARAQELRAGGDPVAVSRVFAATYHQTAAPSDGRGLAVSYVVHAFEMATMRPRFATDERLATGLAGHFVADLDAPSWGRLYLAVLSANPGDDSDQALFASLLPRAWDAVASHLRLQALYVAQFFSGSNEPHRSAILDVLRPLESNNWAIQNTLVEALASFGEIRNPATVEQLQAEIRSTISHPDEIEHCKLASTIASNRFEVENIVGPYFDAIDGLTTQEKARLFVMAARGAKPSTSMHLRLTLDDLTEIVPTGDTNVDDAAKSVFADFANGGPIENAVVVNDAAASCIAAIRGWAKFEAALPPPADDPTPLQRNWRLVARLLLRCERQDAEVDPEETWRMLLRDPQQTIVTLASLYAATRFDQAPLGDLVEHYPEPLRQLFEWAIDNPTEVPVNRLRRWAGTDHFVIRMLGAVGDESTAAALNVHTNHPEAGSAAVDAIREIHRRITP